jgi:hypothetical protein
MPFLVKATVTTRNVNGESVTHQPGTVLSDWEIEPFARQKIMEGTEWYRARFEPLTDREAQGHRIKATLAEPPHIVDGVAVPPPFEDYVGLHPTEVVARLRAGSAELAQRARLYERGGMGREMIASFVHPAEREPFLGYDGMDLRSILEKLEILPDGQVGEVKVYEAAHQNRPAIVEWERETTAQAEGIAEPAGAAA